MNNWHDCETMTPIKGQVVSQFFTRKFNKERKQEIVCISNISYTNI